MSAVALALCALALAVFMGAVVIGEAVAKYQATDRQRVSRGTVLLCMFVLIVGAVIDALT